MTTEIQVFKTPYASEKTRRSYRVRFRTVGPSRTHQAAKRECDINKIMERWQKTGVMTHLNKYEGRYGDFADVQDYQTSMNQVLEADAMFMSLPAKVRARFGNDPAAFLEFATDPENSDELVKLGLAKPRPEDVIDPEAGKVKSDESDKKPAVKPEKKVEPSED